MRIGPATPELPVRSVEEAQRYYRDRMGFRIGWHQEDGRIGAVSRGDCAIFFRETDTEIHPGTFWVFAEAIDDLYRALNDLGAEIVDPIEDKPWGLRQFTVRDLHGHLFHYHLDL
ncbi:VOC family protein [Aestuariibius sp. 2305UL40-4]|uniref:VOC family protein n=1 Tax=Aestuariibius violaceus TaxID=3234132 RepID=UPI00345EC609